jgi:phosphatidylserine/phosphatidylglycerophosphate/cardiolipin synthase-like enzyme
MSTHALHLEFPEQHGINIYKRGSHWIDQPLVKKVRDVFIACSKNLSLGLVVGAAISTILFFAAPISLGATILIGGSVALIITALRSKAIYQSYKKMYDVQKKNTEVTYPEGTPKLGEWTDNACAIVDGGENSKIVKYTLLNQARHSVEISGSYCGGEMLDDFFQIIEKKIEENPEFKVRIISCSDFITKNNRLLAKNLQERFPDNFFFLVTEKQHESFPTVRTYENHTKMLIVDGQVCMTGGTGIAGDVCNDPPSAEQIQKGLNFRQRMLGFMMDTDVVVHGPLAKTMRHQFYQLLSKWNKVTSESNRYGSYHLEEAQRTFEPLKFDLSQLGRPMAATSTTLITSGPEHGIHNEGNEAYLKMIREAKKSIRIANLNFNEPVITRALIDAVNRGVEVSIITNTHNDRSPYSLIWMGPPHMSYLGYLARSVNKDKRHLLHLYEYYTGEKSLLHKKVMVIDDNISVIGSLNINFCTETDEEDIVVMDSHEMADIMKEEFGHDLSLSREIPLSRFFGFVNYFKYLMNEISSFRNLQVSAHIFQ